MTLDYNVTQANLLISAALEESGIRGTAHDIKGLNLRRYFWRVAAVNKDGLEGAFSRVSFFQVVEPDTPVPTPAPTPGTPAPALVLQAVDEVAPGVVHVGGRTVAGATVSVDGTPDNARWMPDGEGIALIITGIFEDGLYLVRPGTTVPVAFVRDAGSFAIMPADTR